MITLLTPGLLHIRSLKGNDISSVTALGGALKSNEELEELESVCVRPVVPHLGLVPDCNVSCLLYLLPGCCTFAAWKATT